MPRRLRAVGSPGRLTQAGFKWRWPSVIRLVLVCALVTYWLAMFFGTHLPRLPKSLAEQSDKVLHFVAYGGLAVLLLGWRASRRVPTLQTVVMLWVLIAVYGLFDEVTQPLVGRHCDFGDWIADITGAGLGLVVTWPIVVRVIARLRAARSTPGPVAKPSVAGQSI